MRQGIIWDKGIVQGNTVHCISLSPHLWVFEYEEALDYDEDEPEYESPPQVTILTLIRHSEEKLQLQDNVDAVCQGKYWNADKNVHRKSLIYVLGFL